MSREPGRNGKHVFRLGLSGLLLLATGVLIGAGASAAPPSELGGSGQDEPAARVGTKEIREPRVEAYLRATVPGWPVSPELQPRLRSAAVEHLVRRELVAIWLEKNGFAATSAEIDWRVDELRAELQRVEKKLEEHLAERSLTLAELQADFGWELAWKKYLDGMLTEEAIAERFRAAPREFDGTELRVAQILLAVSPEQSREQALRLAEEIRSRLQRGEIGWEAAVREHSIAASREVDGDLGWIRRQEPMPEDFSQAAFMLREGELAPPFATRFGVHLVKCLEVRPGKRQLGDVREQVRRELMEREYLRLAESMRGAVEVWIRPQKQGRDGETSPPPLSR